MARLSRPAAVLFDWDGTLADTLPLLLTAHNHVRTMHGLTPWSRDEFMVNIKFSSRELYPSIYGEAWQQALEELYAFVLAQHLEHLTLFPGAAELIAFLHGRNIPLGLVSNKRQLVLDREVAHLGWQSMFYCVLGSGAAARDKPAGDPVRLALARAEPPLDRAKVWFVGDTVSDLAASRDAGCPAVLITHGEDKTGLIADYQPAIVVEDCEKLLDIVKDYA